MHVSDILTVRLRLVAITPQLLDIQEKSPQLLSDPLRAIIPSGWPNVDWEPHVYAFIRTQWETDPSTIGWHRYIMLPQDGVVTLIGGVGSHPLNATEAEVGYGVLEPWQNQGYATEATRGLIDYLFSQGRKRIRAQTYPHLAASLRVMEKCGMHPTGPGAEPGTVSYAIAL